MHVLVFDASLQYFCHFWLQLPPLRLISERLIVLVQTSASYLYAEIVQICFSEGLCRLIKADSYLDGIII